MSGGAVDICGNCGAPLDVDDDGRCRWCRAKVRATRPHARRADGRGPGVRWRPNRRLVAIAAAAIALAAGLGVGLSSYIGSRQAGPPTATGTTDPGVDQAVPPGSTDLQALRQDFGPWQQLTGQLPGRPGLLLQSGNVTSVRATGSRAAITDADGVGYTVAVNQAFVISSNPDTVLLISPGGTVMSMSLAQATAVRQPLGK